MRSYRVPMVPGPTSVPPEVLAAYQVEFGCDAVADPAGVEEAILRFRPKMVTVVHCEAPSGTLVSQTLEALRESLLEA